MGWGRDYTRLCTYSSVTYSNSTDDVISKWLPYMHGMLAVSAYGRLSYEELLTFDWLKQSVTNSLQLTKKGAGSVTTSYVMHMPTSWLTLTVSNKGEHMYRIVTVLQYTIDMLSIMNSMLRTPTLH